MQFTAGFIVFKTLPAGAKRNFPGGTHLHIVDLKYGKGVPVSAVDNSQIRAYALGFLQEMECIYDNLDTVTMHIVQPRINNISDETMPVKDLLHWAETELKPKAEKAANKAHFRAAPKCSLPCTR